MGLHSSAGVYGISDGLILRLMLLLAYFSLEGVKSLKIEVLDGSTVKRSFYDGSAFFEDRSYMIPSHKNEGIQGNLVYPVPRNACSTVENAMSNNSIAFLYEFMDCPKTSAVNLRSAHYIAVLALTQDPSYSRDLGGDLPRAIITDLGTAQYLIHNVLENESHSDWEILIWDDSYANLEKLFVIFASTLLGAVILAIAVFCTILCCRILILRMRTRGLSRLQVRSLPKRKYRKVKETAESCSICLDEFKEGETVRVLPCQHVFHPSCVDEWLQKWNRTCPLCKSTIKKKKGLKASHPAPTTEDETSHLIPAEVTVPVGGGAYGATGYSGPTRDCRCHRRNASGASSSVGVAPGRSSRRHTPQVTTASIELSWESEDGRSTPTFHTPVQSDENITRSFATAHDGESIGVNNVAV